MSSCAFIDLVPLPGVDPRDARRGVNKADNPGQPESTPRNSHSASANGPALIQLAILYPSLSEVDLTGHSCVMSEDDVSV